MSFTKGPWQLCHHLQSKENDESCSCNFPGDIWGPDGEHVICTMGSLQVPGQEGASPPRYERSVELANAKLIAAAPELLEAVELLLSFLCDEIIKDFQLEALRKMATDGMSPIIDLIKKAKGDL
jgi:hypothetical protein